MEINLSERLILALVMFVGSVLFGVVCAIFAGSLSKAVDGKRSFGGQVVGIVISAVFFVLFVIMGMMAIVEWAGWS